MCFHITLKTKKLTKDVKSKGEIVIAYKMLDKNYKGPYHGTETWEPGKVVTSDRRGTKITRTESNNGEINHGIHLYRGPPHPYPCPYRCPCQNPYPYPYPYPCPNPCPYPHLCPNGNKKWMKVEVQPRSIIAVNEDEMVCTKCTPVEEITTKEK